MPNSLRYPPNGDKQSRDLATQAKGPVNAYHRNRPLMAGIRTARTSEGRFVQLANSAGQDPRLSLAARGIIYFVLSLPPGRKFTAAWLETQVPDGRETIRRALAELADCDYLRRTRSHGPDGRWIWEQVLSDAPIPAARPVENDPPGLPPSDGKPSHGLTSNDAPSPQVAPCDGKPSDGFPSDKEIKTGSVNTKDGVVPAVGPRTSVGGRPPDIAAKDKTLAQFGTLARSRTDVPALRPGAKPYTGLCHRCCNGYHPPDQCPTTLGGDHA